MVFTAVAIVTPMALIADMGNHRTERTLDRLARTEDAAARQVILDEEQDSGLLAITLVALLAVAVVVACGYASGAALSEPMAELAQETRRVAEGRLGLPKVTPAEDEQWAAASALMILELQLFSVVKQLQDAGERIGVSAGDLGLSSQQHQAGADEQGAALTATSATTEELARSARQIASNATEVSMLATETLEAARSGKKSADAFYASILKVRDGNQAIADSVVKLNKRVQQVGRVVEFIDGVADKSDLLAVNAELEGNKAGEVGRGFSLVAAEMRRLSESVMRSTREIRGLIDEIRDATNAAVMATEAGVKATDAGSTLASQVSESLGSILDNANQTSDAIKSITLATHQQQSSTDQLADAMNDILRSTQSASGASAHMGRANTELRALAEELKRAVGRFEVSGP
jgi:methyl-accepting chemotaxis protein